MEYLMALLDNSEWKTAGSALLKMSWEKEVYSMDLALYTGNHLIQKNSFSWNKATSKTIKFKKGMR